MSGTSEKLPNKDREEDPVASHLRKHPDYFLHNPDLLRDLQLPHDSGVAVSLIERQVKCLRDEANQCRSRLEKLVSVAQENELLNERLHHLTLTLLDAATFDEVMNALEDEFHDDFQAEAMELRLFSLSDSDPEANPEMHGFVRFLEKGIPQCGHMPMAKLEYLFGPQAAEIRSTALIPIRGSGLLGLLAFGSCNEHRFHPGMGTDYLKRLGEIVSKSLEVVSEPGL